MHDELTSRRGRAGCPWRPCDWWMCPAMTRPASHTDSFPPSLTQTHTGGWPHIVPVQTQSSVTQCGKWALGVGDNLLLGIKHWIFLVKILAPWQSILICSWHECLARGPNETVHYVGNHKKIFPPFSPGDSLGWAKPVCSGCSANQYFLNHSLWVTRGRRGRSLNIHVC